LKEIVGAGDLGAFHLISIATLAGIVIHPIYVTKAFVCKGTRTFDKIHQQYGLGESSINKILSDLSIESKLIKPIIENAACEIFRDTIDGLDFRPEVYDECVRARGTKHPDFIFGDQSIFISVRKKQYEYIDDNKRKKVESYSTYYIMEESHYYVDFRTNG